MLADVRLEASGNHGAAAREIDDFHIVAAFVVSHAKPGAGQAKAILVPAVRAPRLFTGDRYVREGAEFRRRLRLFFLEKAMFGPTSEDLRTDTHGRPHNDPTLRRYHSRVTERCNWRAERRWRWPHRSASAAS